MPTSPTNFVLPKSEMWLQNGLEKELIGALQTIVQTSLDIENLNSIEIDLKNFEEILNALGFIKSDSNLDRIDLLKLWPEILNSFRQK